MDLKKVEKLGKLLLKKYNLLDWNFFLDNAKVRFGLCNYTKKTISISKYLAKLNQEKEVKDTILHEIAHALVGRENNHNKIWKKKAQQIGCSATRCYQAEDIITPPQKYTAYCLHCKFTFQAQKKRKIACGKCCRQYNQGKYCSDYDLIFRINS